MTKSEDWRAYSHMPEEMAKAFVKAKEEALKELGEPPSGIVIDEECVKMTPSAAFDLLYEHDRRLRENVLDAFIDIAQDKFLEFHEIDPEDDHNHFLSNGVEFDESSIVVSR